MQFGGDEKSTLFQKAWSLIIIIGAKGGFKLSRDRLKSDGYRWMA